MPCAPPRTIRLRARARRGLPLIASTSAIAIANGPGKPEGRRRQKRAEPDARRLPGESCQGYPRVRRPRHAVPRHRQVVVRPEERVEPRALCGLGYGELLLVGAAVLRFDKYPGTHFVTSGCKRRVQGCWLETETTSPLM